MATNFSTFGRRDHASLFMAHAPGGASHSARKGPALLHPAPPACCTGCWHGRAQPGRQVLLCSNIISGEFRLRQTWWDVARNRTFALDRPHIPPIACLLALMHATGPPWNGTGPCGGGIFQTAAAHELVGVWQGTAHLHLTHHTLPPSASCEHCTPPCPSGASRDPLWRGSLEGGKGGGRIGARGAGQCMV